MLKRLFALLILMALVAGPAAAEQRIIVRTDNGGWLGALVIKSTCSLLGCKVVGALDGATTQVWLVTTSDLVDPVVFIAKLLGLPGISNAEKDQLLKVQGSSGSEAPAALYDSTPVEFYGSTVRRGYVEQPAVRIIGLGDARYAYNLTGTGVIAFIDTGVDPNHPALKPVLLAGYDFTRNKSGADETKDLDQSTAAMVDQSTAAMVDGQKPFFVNQSTAAMVDQSTAAMVDNPQYAAFGHGTMVAGVLRLVAPKSKLMPLKAFNSDGSGYGSDILRAIYFAANNGANVINMSFSYSEPSKELERACEFAFKKGLILVASVGNDGKKTVAYPAAYSTVMGVASTTDDDVRAKFSNYGTPPVWVAAPGEGIVTTYPGGTYAAAWGTSFSAPFVAGSGGLLEQVKDLNETQAASSVAKAKWVGSELGNGRLDVFLAVQYWRQMAGVK